MVSAHISNLPYPCENELWECRSVEGWAELATSYQQINLSAAASLIMSDNPSSLDSFRSRLIIAYLTTSPSHDGRDSDIELAAFCENLTKHDPSGRYARTDFDIHIHTAAQNTPIRSLLIVSGESWLFGKKLEHEGDFHAAKSQLREWVGSSKAQAALWHATALLRIAFNVGPDTPDQPACEIGSQDWSIGMLHERWCICLAALICWACTFDESTSTELFAASPIASTSILSPILSGTTSPATTASSTTGYPSLMNPVDADVGMRSFLHLTDVHDPSDLPAALVEVKDQTRGLLEVVRTRKINGSSGGLLNEACGVLYRLAEGRSTLSHF